MEGGTRIASRMRAGVPDRGRQCKDAHIIHAGKCHCMQECMRGQPEASGAKERQRGAVLQAECNSSGAECSKTAGRSSTSALDSLCSPPQRGLVHSRAAVRCKGAATLRDASRSVPCNKEAQRTIPALHTCAAHESGMPRDHQRCPCVAVGHEDEEPRCNSCT